MVAVQVILAEVAIHLHAHSLAAHVQTVLLRIREAVSAVAHIQAVRTVVALVAVHVAVAASVEVRMEEAHTVVAHMAADADK